MQVLAVNQAYAGFSGGPFKESDEKIELASRNPARVTADLTRSQLEEVPPLVVSKWQYLYKPMAYDGSKVAVLLMNHDKASADLSVSFADIPGLVCGAGQTCSVRDVWARKDLGQATATYTAKGVAAHDCAFLLICKEGC